MSKRQDLSDCIIGTGIPHANRSYPNYLEEIHNVSTNCSGLRRMGSAAIDLAYVASGKLDGFWEKNFKNGKETKKNYKDGKLRKPKNGKTGN